MCSVCTAAAVPRASHAQICYTEEVDDVLSNHLQTLAFLFEAFADRDRQAPDKISKLKRMLMSLDQWLDMLRELDLVDEQFTTRDATIVFVRCVPQRLLLA